MKHSQSMIAGLTASFALSILTACGGPASNDEGVKGTIAGTSMTLDSDTDTVITLGGEELAFGYMMNCTIGTIISGAVLRKERREDMIYQDVPTVTLKAYTEDGQTGVQVNIVRDGFFYIYEGAGEKDDQSLSWSGAFEKFASDKPAEKIDEVEGSGKITC